VKGREGLVCGRHAEEKVGKQFEGGAEVKVGWICTRDTREALATKRPQWLEGARGPGPAAINHILSICHLGYKM
jgi:hypothetical protein